MTFTERNSLIEFSKISERDMRYVIYVWNVTEVKSFIFLLILRLFLWVIIYQHAPPTSLHGGVWSTKFKSRGCITSFYRKALSKLHHLWGAVKELFPVRPTDSIVAASNRAELQRAIKLLTNQSLSYCMCVCVSAYYVRPNSTGRWERAFQEVPPSNSFSSGQSFRCISDAPSEIFLDIITAEIWHFSINGFNKFFIWKAEWKEDESIDRQNNHLREWFWCRGNWWSDRAFTSLSLVWIIAEKDIWIAVSQVKVPCFITIEERY